MVVHRFTYFQIPKPEDVQAMIQQYRILNNTATRVRKIAPELGHVKGADILRSLI